MKSSYFQSWFQQWRRNGHYRKNTGELLKISYEYSELRTSVTNILAHFLIICDHLREFRTEFWKTLFDATNVISIFLMMQNITNKCLWQELKFQIYEHLCGVENEKKFHEALIFATRNIPNESIYSAILKVKAIQSIDSQVLLFLAPFYPPRLRDFEKGSQSKERKKRRLWTDHDG